MKSIRKYTYLLLLICAGCSQSPELNEAQSNKRPITLNKVSPEQSGIDFRIDLDEESLKNPFNYINLYCGGGVSIGDINNDNLQDIFFTSNTASSKLYLNKGNMRFEDITESAGIGTTGWCSATTMADINNDGYLDIYVCRSYHDSPDERKNLMYINNGDGSFTEKATELGIDDSNYSIACSFADFDRDGDLDLIVGNHPRFQIIPFNIHYQYRTNPVKKFSNRLFRNDGNKFSEITEKAGLLTYGHTLGVNTSDFNLDGFPDIFLTVDHEESDYLFLNQGDGTFLDVTKLKLKQTTRSSMGVDAGDINHDKYPDFVVAEMLSKDHFREKILMDMATVDRFNHVINDLGYSYYQMHNFLHLNNSAINFSDVSQLAGVNKSDWSWSTLLADLDNDKWQDLFITNGLYKNILERDSKKMLDKKMELLGADMEAKNKFALEHAISLPVDRISNFLFKNKGNLSFEIYSDEEVHFEPTISTGAAYGDLDNDGDLDLVVSNVGDIADVFENTSNTQNYLRIKADVHPDINYMNSRIYLYAEGDIQSRELITTRGFQSSSEPIAHFGLGSIQKVDTIEFIWPDGRLQRLFNQPVNTTLTLKYGDAIEPQDNKITERPSIVQQITPTELGIDFKHKENPFRDYDIQVLLPHKQSEYGPFPVVADVNHDGMDDIFFPAPHQQIAQLYIQKPNGKFELLDQKDFKEDRKYEDGHAAFADVNGDGEIDLIVSSSGYEFLPGDALYEPRLYLNDGKAGFKRKSQAFGEFAHSSSCVKLADFDKDGDLDIFMGGRLKPHAYPFPGTSALFVNDGTGQFENRISTLAPGLEKAGMVKDALWEDIDNDGDYDLLVVGEWMPVSVWLNTGSGFEEKTQAYFDTVQKGWWNCIQSADLDGDGRNEFIVGNLGLNYKYKASNEKPFTMYAKDFDSNGKSDIVLGAYYGDDLFPVRGKTCSTQQLPEFKDEYQTYRQYASLELDELYGDRLEGALKYEVNQFASVILKTNEQGRFDVIELPRLAQISPVNGIVTDDVNNDGRPDLIIAGNLFQSEIETGRADAGNGLVLINEGKLHFKPLTIGESGLCFDGDVKSLVSLKISDKKAFLAGINGGTPKLALTNGSVN